MAEFERFSPEEVRKYVLEKIPQIDANVLDKIVEHKIDGETFLVLNEEYLCEVAPLLGDRLKIKKLIVQLQAEESVPSLAIGRSVPTCDAELTAPIVSKEILRKEPLIDVAEGDSIYSESDSGLKTSDVLTKDENRSVQSPEAMKSAVATGEIDWAEALVIPKRFSTETTAAIKSGKLNNKARDEVINSLATLMMVHTIKPTSSDYNTVCSKLVRVYPLLKDSADSEFLEKKLRMKFKNLRRPSRSKAAGIVIEPPVAKKAKTNECDVVVDPVGYERHVEYLQNSYASKKWSVANMMTLLEQTAHQRREWISKETPLISEILKTFPCFADPRIMMKEFCLITGADETKIAENWLATQLQVLEFAKQEQRNAVKKLLCRYHEYKKDSNDDRTTTYALMLLAAFLLKGKARIQLFIPFEGNCTDIAEALEMENHKAPFVAAFGETVDVLSDYMVVMEKDNVISMPTLAAALHYCFASYYVFNISYPPDSKSLMLFLESHVYGLKPSLKLPLSVAVLIDNLLKCKESND